SLQVVVCEGAVFDGELRFKGLARVAGQMKGEIKGKGRLIIESTAQVSADITTDHLVLLGDFKGKVKAGKTVLMEPPARFSGEVSSPSLTIKEGVFFEGSSKRVSS
ncbi:MAG: polymer-forming cytoskeletal protein, partial [Oligoflexia bacterium]|nr:polymer-forming cytoskeletal protein [Oligoflexia bacterium]